MQKRRGKAFPKGNKLAKGGKRSRAGRPTNEAKTTKKAELEAKKKELEIAKDVWERKIRAREDELATRYVDQALTDNRILLDLRKTRIPDAQNDKDTQDQPPVIYNIVDANTARIRQGSNKNAQNGIDAQSRVILARETHHRPPGVLSPPARFS